MHIVLLILVGAGAGFIATRLLGLQLGVFATIGIGIGGALIGALVLRFLLLLTGAMAGLVGAVLGALLLVGLWKLATRR